MYLRRFKANFTYRRRYFSAYCFIPGLHNASIATILVIRLPKLSKCLLSAWSPAKRNDDAYLHNFKTILWSEINDSISQVMYIKEIHKIRFSNVLCIYVPNDSKSWIFWFTALDSPLIITESFSTNYFYSLVICHGRQEKHPSN